MLNHFYQVTVFRINYQGIFSAMSIICQSVSLVLMSCIALVAVDNKFKNPSDLVTTGLTISFSIRLADLVTSIVGDLSRLELMMKIYIVRTGHIRRNPCMSSLARTRKPTMTNPKNPRTGP